MVYIADGLHVIANKAPVVATHVGGFDQENAARTFVRYEKEASTYVCPPQLEDYQNKLLDAVLDDHTAIGCLVAPFGYGKTSTAIGIWRACEGRKILGVPPFSCGSIAEMGQAIASGLLYRLADNASAVSQIKAAYRNYLVASAHRLAEQDVEQFHIDFDTALKSIEDKIERGYLQLEASGTHMLLFLEQLTQVVREAGFAGLLVIVDEFQQFLGNINKAVITNFRTLVWGLRTRGASPFGLLITMDPETERNLADRAGDILHRIKEDGLYLDFSGVYDREFPRQLWTRYTETYGFSTQSQQVIDRATLDAIGQLCERPDLSNGPRTVIDVFQRIAATHNQRQHAYTPIDLIDDFMMGNIRFDGDRSKVASLVTELTGYDVIKRVPQKYQALKLIAAFPRGCPREVAEQYALEEAYDQLSDELRGEVVVTLPEGVALIDLQRVGKPQNKLNIILKKYWLQITEEEIIADRAVRLFAEYVLSSLFPPFSNVLAGWKPYESTFTLSSSESYYQIFEGTFFEEYPMRRVCVEVCRHKDQIAQFDTYFDAQLVFVICRDEPALAPPKYIADQRQIIVFVPINRPFGRSLPRDVRWIEDYLKPVVMTPGVMLSLLSYIDQQLSLIEGMTETERTRILDHHRKLQDFLLTMVFGEELFALPEFQVISRGRQALRDVLFAVFRRAYPEYQTLINSPQWETQMRDYVRALECVNPVIGRGLEPLRGNKSEIAKCFSMGSYAGFESRARQFAPLVSVLHWEKDQGEVQFNRHPGEVLILRLIALQPSIDADTLAYEVRKRGYVADEIAYLLKFLTLRGYIQFEADTGNYSPTQTLSEAELRGLAHKIREETDLLAQVDVRIAQEIGDRLKEIERLMADSNTDLMEVQIRLLQVEGQVRESRPHVVQTAYEALVRMRSELFEKATALSKPLVTSYSGLSLDTHLNGGMRTMTGDRERTSKRLSLLTQSLQGLMDTPINPDDLDAIRWLIDSTRRASKNVAEALESADVLLQNGNHHTEMVKLVEKIARQFPLIEVIAQFTQTETLRAELEAVRSEIQERLATIGLPDYRTVLGLYTPRVDSVASEIDIALRAMQAKQSITKLTAGQPSRKSSRKTAKRERSPRDRLLDLLDREHLSFSQVLSVADMPPEQIVMLLHELEIEGEIVIHIRRKGQVDD